MKKADARAWLQDNGHSYLANVIETQHDLPAAKFKGAIKLIKAGYSVRVASFDISRIVVANGMHSEAVAFYMLERSDDIVNLLTVNAERRARIF